MLVRLASGSPRRLELLRQIGLEVDVYTSAFDEVSGDNAEKVVAVNALGKGQVVVEQVGSEIPVIAADTMVVLENEILGKPFDSNDAAVMLRKLSGRVHRVLTGVAYQKLRLMLMLRPANLLIRLEPMEFRDVVQF